MRTVIIIGVMAVVLFSAAAGASIFLTNYLSEKNKAPKDDAAAAQDSAKELPPLARGGESGSRSRPGAGSPPDTEQLVQELAKLRERQESVARREQQLARRQRDLEIIKEDIRGEREEIDRVRKELSEQVKGAEEDLAALERRVQELDRKREQTEEQLVKDAKTKVYEADTVRAGGIKRVGNIMDTAEPAEVARIFETMVESGDLMTAAQILANMKDRRAAQVLAAFQDKATAAQLAEKMVGLKQQTSGANPPGGGRAPRPTAPPDGSSR
jgi:chromosome segregation ATPase